MICGRRATDDVHIAVRLRTIRHVTFFSGDRDFFTKRLEFGHSSLAIVFVDATASRFPELVDRFLRHRSSKTHASRMGRVFKLNEQAVTVWRVSDRSQTEMHW